MKSKENSQGQIEQGQTGGVFRGTSHHGMTATLQQLVTNVYRPANWYGCLKVTLQQLVTSV